MADIWQLRRRLEDNLVALKTALEGIGAIPCARDFGSGASFAKLTADVGIFQRSIDAWKLLHPNYRYILFVGRTSSGKSSLGNCLLQAEVFEVDPNEKTDHITFVGADGPIQALKTLGQSSARSDQGVPSIYLALKEERGSALRLGEDLILIDSPGFGADHVTNNPRAGRAKELLRGMLPLVDHIAYLVQPSNPLNDVDGVIREIIKDDLRFIPLTVVMAKCAGYRIDQLGPLKKENLKWDGINTAIQNVRAFFHPYTQQPLRLGDDFFHVETDAGPKNGAVQVGMRLVPNEDEKKPGRFEDGIDPVRHRLAQIAETDGGTAILRRTKMLDSWRSVHDATSQRQSFFEQQTRQSLDDAVANEHEYKEIVRARTDELAKFWNESAQSVSAYKATVKQSLDEVFANANPGGFVHRLTQAKERIGSKKASEAAQVLRTKVQSVAEERGRAAAGDILLRINQTVSRCIADPARSVSTELSNLVGEVDDSLNARTAFQQLVPDDFLSGIDGQTDLSEQYRAIANDIIKQALKAPEAKLDALLKSIDLQDRQTKLEGGLNSRIRTTIENAERSLSVFRKIVRLDASELSDNEEYELGLARVIRDVVEGPSKSANDPQQTRETVAKSQTQRLREAVIPAGKRPEHWREALLVGLKAASTISDKVSIQPIEAELAKIEPPKPPPVLTIQTRATELATIVDSTTRNAIRARTEVILSRVRVPLETRNATHRSQQTEEQARTEARRIALEDAEKNKRKIRVRAAWFMAGAVVVALAMLAILFFPANIKQFGVNVAEFRTGIATSAYIGMLGCAILVGLPSIFALATGRPPTGATIGDMTSDFLAPSKSTTTAPQNASGEMATQSERLPQAPDLATIEELLPNADPWQFSDQQWSPVQKAIERAFEQFGTDYLEKFKALGPKLDQQGQYLRSAARSAEQGVTDATAYLIVRYGDGKGLKKAAFEKEVMDQRDQFTSKILEFYNERLQALSELRRRLDEIAVPERILETGNQ